MKLDSLNIDKFVTLRSCKEITNPVYFIAGNIPTEDGLFSHDIFGRPGSRERKVIFGYVNLKRKFVHPTFYKLFISMDKKIADLLTGRRYFTVDKNGELIEDDKNGKSGVSYFYEIYDKLNFKNTGSDRRTDYIKILNNVPKNDIFLDKFLVIPPYLRDYNPSKTDSFDVKSVDEVNDMYAKLIRLSQSISDSNSGYNFMGVITESSIQLLLFDIYKYYTSKLSKKTGMIHQSLLGKNIDYATRSVISAPRMNAKHYKDLKVRFGTTGIPLSQIVVLFYPFFVKYIQDYIYEREHEISNFEWEGEKVVIKNVREQFSEEVVKKLVSLYIKSIGSRFKTLTVAAPNGKEYPINLFREDLKRNFTITDMLFIAAKDICEDKHVYISRYPIEQYRTERYSISL